MKTLIRNPLFVMATIALLVGGYFLVDTFSAKAQQNTYTNNLVGAAWASTPGTQGQGVGWIALTNNTGGSYGVSINPTISTPGGNISGQGWSEHVGWLNFDPSGGFPTQSGNWPVAATLVVPGNQADYPGTMLGDIVGWAKFEPLDGNSGGWDGWVSMRGSGNGVSFGVRIIGDFTTGNGGDYCSGVMGFCPMGGYAWGDMVGGWIDFSYASANLDNVVITDICMDGLDNETTDGTHLPGLPDGTPDNCDPITYGPEICDNNIDDDNDGDVDEVDCDTPPTPVELCDPDTGGPNGVNEDGDSLIDEGCITTLGEICWNTDANGNYIDDNNNNMVNEGCPQGPGPTNGGSSINPIYQEI